MTGTGSPPAERVLAMSRRWSAGRLAGTLLFASAGVYWIMVGFLPGWLVVALFASGALLAAANLVRPSTLRLDPDGFALTTPLGRGPRRHRWSECSGFAPWGPAKRMKAKVAYRSDSPDKPLRRAAATLFLGGDEMIDAGFERLSAPQLAQLMNEYQESVVGPRPAERPPLDVRERASQPAGRWSRVLNAVLFVLTLVLFGGAYAAYRLDGPPTLWIPLAIACAGCLIGYVWRD